jgi:hypothetical protein
MRLSPKWLRIWPACSRLVFNIFCSPFPTHGKIENGQSFIIMASTDHPIICMTADKMRYTEHWQSIIKHVEHYRQVKFCDSRNDKSGDPLYQEFLGTHNMIIIILSRCGIGGLAFCHTVGYTIFVTMFDAVGQHRQSHMESLIHSIHRMPHREIIINVSINDKYLANFLVTHGFVVEYTLDDYDDVYVQDIRPYHIKCDRTHYYRC